MSDTNPSGATRGIATALVVCNDPFTIEQLGVSMEQLALTQENCSEIPTALVWLNRRKFDAVVVDLQLEGPVKTVLDRVRRSPSNRTAVLFAISGSDAETIDAFRVGSNFVLRRPLSASSISRTLKVAYGLILRERRRYFRCPVDIAAMICGAGMPDVHGQIINISENGMAVATSVALQPGLEVQVRFNLPGNEAHFVVGAVICWCKDGRIGLQLSSVAAHLTAELQEWLLARLEENLPQPLADRLRRITSGPHIREGALK